MKFMREARRATVRDMRRSNRAMLLSKIYLDGPLSRHELTQLTSLSPASVSTLVAEFLDEGLVEEAGSVESAGGRARVLPRVAPGLRHGIGGGGGQCRRAGGPARSSPTAGGRAYYCGSLPASGT